jgi:hypothetical protein
MVDKGTVTTKTAREKDFEKERTTTSSASSGLHKTKTKSVMIWAVIQTSVVFI